VAHNTSLFQTVWQKLIRECILIPIHPETDKQRSGQNIESRRDRGRYGVLDIYRSGRIAKDTEEAG